MHLLPFASTAFLLFSSPLPRSTEYGRRRLSVALSSSSPPTATVDSRDSSSSSSSSSSMMEITMTPPEKYQDLITWLQANQAHIGDKVQIQPSSNGVGSGVFVTADVQADELLFSIPRALCITTQAAKQDPVVGKAFQQLIDKAGPGGNTVVLAGFIAQEWLKVLDDVNKNEKNLLESSSSSSSSGSGSGSGSSSGSRFGPYLQTLPWKRGVNSQEHTLYWSDEDIETYLKGSLCYAEAKALREEVDLAIRVMNGIIGKPVREYRGEEQTSNGDGFKWPWEVQPEKAKANEMLEGLPEAMKGAFVVLLTRAFQDGDEDEEKLVPMLDILQHSDEPNIRHAMRKDDRTVEVRARHSLQAGEELLNQYRSEMEENMPYYRFFTRYGFVPGIQESIQDLLTDKSSIFFAKKVEV